MLCLGVGLVACGGSETTTVTEEDSANIEALQLEKEIAEQEAAKAKSEAKKEAQEAKRAKASSEVETEPASTPEPEPESVPDVVGMKLPKAESTLSATGYETEPENTDTTFGIVVPSNYTICEQRDPVGTTVVVLAQKYGC